MTDPQASGLHRSNAEAGKEIEFLPAVAMYPHGKMVIGEDRIILFLDQKTVTLALSRDDFVQILRDRFDIVVSPCSLYVTWSRSWKTDILSITYLVDLIPGQKPPMYKVRLQTLLDACRM